MAKLVDNFLPLQSSLDVTIKGRGGVCYLFSIPTYTAASLHTVAKLPYELATVPRGEWGRLPKGVSAVVLKRTVTYPAFADFESRTSIEELIVSPRVSSLFDFKF